MLSQKQCMYASMQHTKLACNEAYAAVWSVRLLWLPKKGFRQVCITSGGFHRPGLCSTRDCSLILSGTGRVGTTPIGGLVACAWCFTHSAAPGCRL